MTSEEIYSAWKQKKRQISVGEDFSNSIMNEIYGAEHKSRAGSFDLERFIEDIAARPWAKATVVVGGTIAGLARFAAILWAYLA